jgi:hypothetical protein
MRKRKGIQPRYWNLSVEADAFPTAEGNIKGVNSHDHRDSTGVLDRGTSLWQSRELGRSHGFLIHGVGWHNWLTRRKPNNPWEVGCLHSSDEME